MTTLVTGANALNMSTLNFDHFSQGTVTTHSATTIVVDYGNGIIDTYTGTGFGGFNGLNVPSTGLITGFQRTSSGNPVVTISGVSLSVEDFTSFTLPDNSPGLIAEIFRSDDTITGSAQGDTLLGGGGVDILRGGAGNDTLNGGDDASNRDIADFSDATAGITVSLAVATAQSIGGGLGNDTLIDIGGIIGSNFGDNLTGNGSNNSFEGRGGNDTINGSSGTDLVIYTSATGNIIVNLATAGAQVIGGGQGNDTLTSIEDVLASNFNDTITGNTLANFLGGMGGNDTLNGGDGNDILRGGAGTDILNGGVGSDTANYETAADGVAVDLSVASAQAVGGGEGTDTLTLIENLRGSEFNDTLRGSSSANFIDGGFGDDVLSGGAGNDTLEGGGIDDWDTVSYANAASAVTVHLGSSAPQTISAGEGQDTLQRIEAVIGSAFNDTLSGNFTRASGLSGGDGNDTLNAGYLADIIDGGAGTDVVSFENLFTGVVARLDYGMAVINGIETTLTGLENLTGSNFNDELTGETGANILNGGEGNDELDGGWGNDTLNGGAGIDLASYASANMAVTVDLRLSSQSVNSNEGTDTYVSIEGVLGSSSPDRITGNAQNNVLNGGTGFAGDTLIGLGGDDTMDGDDGFDTVSYEFATGAVLANLASGVATGEGSDTLISIERLIGTSFDDTFTGTDDLTFGNMFLGRDGNDTLNGGGGGDWLEGGAGVDLLEGGEGNDLLNGGTGDDQLNGGDGNDSAAYDNASGAVVVDLTFSGVHDVGGGEGLDTFNSIESARGSAFNDVLIGTAGRNELYSNAGNDIVRGGGGGDYLYADVGIDTVDYSNMAESVEVSLHFGFGRSSLGEDTVYNFENAIGSEFADTLTGDGQNNYIQGLGGNDVIYGAQLHGIISGTSASDILDGGAGNDTLGGSHGNDQLIGGDGIDTADYLQASNVNFGITVNLGLTGAQNVGGNHGTDTLSSIENLRGTTGGDTLVGNADANVLRGNNGNDTINGGAGNDAVFGEEGNDSLFGGPDIDDLFGGNGDDLMYVVGSDGVLEGGAGYDQVIVLDGAGVNITIETGVEYVAGNNGADVLSAAGTTTAIVIGGADGNDVLTGGSGNDTLAGMNDEDVVNGGGGNDQLFAGAGSDDFFGGDGDDLIYILGNDDVIQGDAGYDQAIILDTAGVSITIEATTEYCAGNNGNDTIDGSTLSTVMTLGGAGGDDVVRGGSAGDTMSGSFGIDTLYGNGGADIIFGGDDNDALYGGTGNDQLFGGNGADVMFIEDSSGIDSVSGFVDGVDLFDFSLHTSVTDFSQLTISTLGGDALVDFTGGQLFIAGAAGLIEASDFVFA